MTQQRAFTKTNEKEDKAATIYPFSLYSLLLTDHFASKQRKETKAVRSSDRKKEKKKEKKIVSVELNEYPFSI